MDVVRTSHRKCAEILSVSLLSGDPAAEALRFGRPLSLREHARTQVCAHHRPRPAGSSNWTGMDCKLIAVRLDVAHGGGSTEGI